MEAPVDRGDSAEGFAPWLEQRKQARLQAQRAKRKRAGIATLCVAGVVVFSAVWNPPTGSVHAFTKESDYRPSKESGCTNSGKGCHGTDASRSDFNVYHRGVPCTSCHDYQGVGCIPCHKPSSNECELCHDGSVKNVSDVVRLSDPFPRGHYRETTHTAMGTDFEASVRTVSGGKAAASCADCHSRDLERAHAEVKPAKGSTYGASVGCGECHNDARSGGVDQVLSKWKTRRCEDCHGKGAAAPMHGAVASAVAAKGVSCASTGSGCHEGSDLHALHPDKPAKCAGSAVKGEPGCHTRDAASLSPTATACGSESAGCHASYAGDGFGHTNDRTTHSPGRASARDTSYHGIPCGDCHHMADDGRSLVTEHALPTSARTHDAANVCRDCHNDPASADTLANTWPGRDTVYACSDCHGTKGLARDHTADLAPSHASASPGCGSTGPGCHPTSDLSEVGKPTTAANLHATCLRCHDSSPSGGDRAYDPSKKTCGAGRSCHAYDPKTSIHTGRAGRIDGDDAKHAAGDRQAGATYTDVASGVVTPCASCHSMVLGTEHVRPSATVTGTGDACVRCHDRSATTAEVVKGGWSARDSVKACAACHGASGVRAPHLEIASAHSDVELSLFGVPSPGTCVRSGCHATADVRVLHQRLGCTVLGCHSARGDIDGTDVRGCGGLDRATSCHVGYSDHSGHADMSAVHDGEELDASGTPKPGACVRSGCHTSRDVRKLHGDGGCTVAGCHNPQAEPSELRCGGRASDGGCHPGFTADQHFVDHDADRRGTVSGIAYRAGANRGCFGCHSADLASEHSTGTAGDTIAGGGANDCRVCHYDANDPGSGAYADLPAVKAAIQHHDVRCIACHASGSSASGTTAVASPHKRTSSSVPVPRGRVWADPAEEWKAAFDAPTGGGHNDLPASAVGADAGKSFPVTSLTWRGVTYRWPLPPNSGDTLWLRPSVFGSGLSSGDIRELRVTCADCHVVPAGMNGPHGSAVRVWIDPHYSQTEYSDPSGGTTSQFEATGTKRVVCFKCHTIAAGSVPGTDSPGGAYVHAQHAEHPGFPDYNPVRWGEKCIDCHVRIPHAWRHQRLLVRTLETSDGVPADTYPYVARGYDGLRGVILEDFSATGGPPPSACVTGGCHGRHNDRSHPMASDVPTASLWP